MFSSSLPLGTPNGKGKGGSCSLAAFRPSKRDEANFNFRGIRSC
jgi:hypothetical protein